MNANIPVLASPPQTNLAAAPAIPAGISASPGSTKTDDFKTALTVAGKASERMFLPLMRMQLPEVRDICMPAEGVFHNLILVSIRKTYPGHARKVMHAIWGLGQAMFSKCIVVVDEDVDVQNVSEVAWKALNNIDPQRDIEFCMGPVDSLDHASRLPDYGSKMGVDATRKIAGEGFTRRWPDVIQMSPDVVERVPYRATEGATAYDGLRLPVSIVLDNVRSMYNVGAFFRTADGAGIERLLLSGITARPPMKEMCRRRRLNPSIFFAPSIA